jgi:hypothetical protein
MSFISWRRMALLSLVVGVTLVVVGCGPATRGRP